MKHKIKSLLLLLSFIATLFTSVSAQDAIDALQAARMAKAAAEKAQAEADAATEAAIEAAARKAASQARSNAKQAREDQIARRAAISAAAEEAELDAAAAAAGEEAKRRIAQELGIYMPGSSSPAENPIESIILNSKMVNNGRKYFHFSPDIPKKKAKNAIKKYAKGINREDILFLYDYTVFGSAKDGFFITEEFLCYKMFLDKNKILLSEIRSIEKRGKRDDIYLNTNIGSERLFFFSKEDGEIIFEMLSDIIDYFKKPIVSDKNTKSSFSKIHATEFSENIKKPKYPANLEIERLQFTESSGNQSLDGLETGKITFDLVNNGKGYATDIDINITPILSRSNLRYESSTNIKKLSSKSSKTVEIPFTANIKTKSMDRKFRIEVSEYFGFDADPALISFTTTAFLPPDLQINQTAIDDDDDGDSQGNGNSIIESGESIEVTVFIQNFGDGDAENVKAEVVFNTTDRHISYPDVGTKYNLGDITGGDYQELKFYFYTSKRYNTIDLPISVQLTESKGEYGKIIDLGLKAGERTQNIVDVQIARVETQERQRTMREIEGIVTLADVDKNIPETNEDGENTLAVIVGIQDYKYAPNVDYADRDAQYFYEYSKSVLGIPEPNIYFRLDDGATSGEFNKIFAEDGWIARRMGPSTDIIFYYSGHGAPDPKSEKGFLIPHDIDPNYANTGFSLDEIYESLSALEANSVSVFIDACFSGESRSEEMLIAGIRPISIEIASPVLTAENFSVFSASTGKQYSSAYPEKFHGLFTYFLLKGLQGEAKGRDKKLTLGELYDYVEKNVSRQAGYLDKEQNPTFIGSNEDRVIVRY